MAGFLKQLVGGVLAALCVAGAAEAQVCPKVTLTDEILTSWYNPKPARDDLLVPIPGNLAIVFTPVPLGGKGLYLGEQTVYDMGYSKDNEFAFETRLRQTRVGSAITDANEARLLIGKYELSKGQYAMIIGKGDLRRGIAELAQRSGDKTALNDLLGDYLDPNGKCSGVITRRIADFLAEPLSFLTYGDYVQVIDQLNLYCIGRADCQSILTSLGENPDLPGFFRLPTEHEWEFVARGGRDFVAGRLARATLQADVPFVEVGKSLASHAHLNSDPPRLEAIGSREPWFGFHDMIGNVEELMQNPFTAENGFGAVGAYVARGGHYRHRFEDVRVSRRVELSVFARDETAPGSPPRFVTQHFPLTGLRLAIGLPIAGVLGRLGDSFAGVAQDYQRPEEAGDIAGDTIVDANVMGALAGRGLEAGNGVSGTDTHDYFAFDLREFASVSVALTADSALNLSLIDEQETPFFERRVNAGAAESKLDFGILLPGRYYLLLAHAGGSPEENKYKFTLSREVLPDTGIERPDTQALASGQSVSGRGFAGAGFVGGGDRTDFYPFKVDDTSGGLRIAISEHTAPLNVSLLDERAQVVAQATGAAGSEIELLAPVDRGWRGFLQVTSDGTTSTLYRLQVESRALYDTRVFRTRRTSTSAPGLAKKAYDGYLGAGTSQLTMLVRLAEARKLRAELSGLGADVNLELLNSAGRRVETNSQRDGTTPEFIEMNLEAGVYYLQVSLKDAASVSKFRLYYDLLEFAGTRTFDPRQARAAATTVTASDAGYYRDFVYRGEPQYYSFRATGGRQLVTVDIGGYKGDTDLDIFLEDASGTVLAKSQNTGDAAETVKQMLTSGVYYVRVQSSGTATRDDYYLSVLSVSSMREPVFPGWFGQLVERNEDWAIYRNGDDCQMVTVSEQTIPDLGWLATRPYFYMGVQRGSRSAWVSLFTSSSSGKDEFRSTPEARVHYSNGSSTKLYVAFKNGEAELKPLVSCSNAADGWCISTESVRGFRRGTYLTLQGTTASGEDLYIRYSLKGYTKSANRINSLCGASAGWITGN